MSASNPFEEHAQNMKAYEYMLAVPIDTVVGNFIECALFTAAGPVASKQYVATIGQFVLRQVLVAGGFSPRLMGQAIIRKSTLPAKTYFKTGQELKATQVGGSIHQCQIESIEDTFTEWRLNLWSKNQSA